MPFDTAEQDLKPLHRVDTGVGYRRLSADLTYRSLHDFTHMALTSQQSRRPEPQP